MTLQEKAKSIYGSASQVRDIAFWAHNIPGYILIVIGMCLLLVGFGYYKKQVTYFYSFTLLAFALIFTLFIFFGKGLKNLATVTELVFAYPEIYVHLLQVVAIIIGTTFEILYEKGVLKNRVFYLIFPLSFAAIGLTNILHPHTTVHSDKDMFIHSLMGSFFLLTAIFLVIARLTTKAISKVFLALGVGSLIYTGYLFASFKDSNIAYEFAFPQKSVEAANYIDFKDIATVYIVSDRVIPQDIRIKKGGSVKFIQVDSSWHDIASGPHPTHTEYPPLNIGLLNQGESKVVTFPNSGSYGFHDHINDENSLFQGRILVTD